MRDLSIGPLGPDPLVRSNERHLHAEARSAARVTDYLIAVRQADAFDEAYPSNPLDSAGRGYVHPYP
jgi:hypothetical protein